MDNIPKPTRPRQVVCFMPVEFPTQQDGDVYLFLAKDVHSELLFQTGMETSNTNEMILKHIRLLMNNQDFKKHSGQPFTLVLHKYAELRAEIEAIIKPHGGALEINDPYLSQQMVPVLVHLFQSLAQKP